MNEHTKLCRKIRTTYSKDPDRYLRIFSNPVGQGYTGKAVWSGSTVTIDRASTVKYGLAPGSADLIGWASVLITPEMVGKRVAIFTAFEVKTGSGKLSGWQKDFLKSVSRAGGIIGTVRDIKEPKAILLEHGFQFPAKRRKP